MSAGPAAAHRPAVRRSPAPRAPRRVSGPARGRAATRQAAGTVALPQPSAQPLAPRLVDVLVSLPDARWLDRLMRGRAWIALIALALIGLVFMQVSMLGMNAGIGQKVERSATLERQIADERAAVSALSDPERIQKEAAAMGMVQPKPGDVSYLRSRGSRADGALAARTMTEPSPEAAAAATAGAATGTAEAVQNGALPPTDAALQAQQEEAQAADTVPGAATQQAATQQPQPTAQAQPQQQPQAQTQQQPQAQTQQQPQAQTQQAPPPQQQPTPQTTPQATAQTQQQPQATGATAAPTGQ